MLVKLNHSTAEILDKLTANLTDGKTTCLFETRYLAPEVSRMIARASVALCSDLRLT